MMRSAQCKRGSISFWSRRLSARVWVDMIAVEVEGEPPSAKDRADIEATMKSDGQLAAARFSSITFASTSIAKQPDGRLLVTGRLTIRGVAQDVKFPAQVALDGGLLRGRAQITFKQSSFGYQPYRAVLGAIQNKDEVILHIDLGAKAP